MGNQLTQEQQNKIFDALRKEYGDEILETKLQRLESARKYYRRFPYDGWQKRAGMDAVDLAAPSNPLKELIANESRDELLDGLTERELWVATMSEQGYKPGDMAFIRGKSSSGADRWIKWNVRRKMEAKLTQ